MTTPLPAWKQAALQLLPQMEDTIEEAETPYLLWYELRSAFEAAYDKNPPDESLIGPICRFFDWCVEAPRGTGDEDLLTSAIVCFLEHVPEHSKAREDMPRWLAYEEVAGSESIFSYHLGHQGYLDLVDHMKRNQHRHQGRGASALPE